MPMNILCLCFTPFHLAILSKYLEKSTCEKERFTVLYIGPIGLQERHYAAGLTIRSSYRSIEPSVSRFITAIKIVFCMMTLDERFDAVYSGNLKLFYARWAILFGRKSQAFQIMKFDDGIGELLEESWFTEPEDKRSEILFQCLHRRLTWRNLKFSPRIFSIYKRFCDASTTYVPLLPENLDRLTISTKTTAILLGQCYSNNPKVLSPQHELQAIKNAISQFSIDIFIPHPLSELDVSELTVKVVAPATIAEEFVAAALRGGPCAVYGFRTTTIFNLDECLRKQVSDGYLRLNNITLYRDGNPLSPSWSGDIWDQKFPHIEVSSDQKFIEGRL